MSIEETEAEPHRAKASAKAEHSRLPAATISSQITTKPELSEGSPAPVRRVTRPRLPTFDPVRKTGPVNLNLIAEGVRKEARLALTTVVGIGLCAALQIASQLLSMLNAASDQPSRSIGQTATLTDGLAALVQLCAGLAFFMWVYRACSNVRLVGDRSSAYSPGWCIGWWFVPVASIVMPLIAVRDVWRRSITVNDMRSSVVQENRADLAKANVLSLLWWLAYVGGGTVILFMNLLRAVEEKNRGPAVDGIAINVISMGSTLLSGILAIVMIKSIDRWQRNFNVIAPVSKIFE